MPYADFFLAQGNRLPVLEDVLFSPDGRVIDLTGYTVSASMRGADGCGAVVRLAGVLEVVDARAGLVRYSWAATDTAVPGLYLFAWTVTLADGRTIDVPNDDYIRIRIRPKVA